MVSVLFAPVTSNDPYPLVYNSTGNVDINISTKANAALWEQQGLGTSYFQYADENSSSWANWESTYTLLLANLSYVGSGRELEVRVEAPPNEGAGDKSTSIMILGASIE